MSDEARFELRHGTQDKEVFDEVYVNNEYELPDKFPENSLVLDIGANIGAFTAACLQRGAASVVAFEPDPFNFIQLQKNVAAWHGQTGLFQAAIRRSDKYVDVQYIGFDDNTACGGTFDDNAPMFKGSGREPIHVESMGLDELLCHATEGGGRRVNLLKIDVEGSEYAILYTTQHLDVVDNIVIETHETPGWPSDTNTLFGYPNSQASSKGMKAFLEKNGFTVRVKETFFKNQTNSIVFGTRTPTPEQK